LTRIANLTIHLNRSTRAAIERLFSCPKGAIMAKISPAGIAMILAIEVSSEAVYARRDAHPTWPEGYSGITIGIGFDLGYEDPATLAADFPDLSPGVLARLREVCGLKGEAADAALKSVADIVIPYDDAYAAFVERTLPRYERMTRVAFPGSDALPDDCFSALVSLVYNRGTAMNSHRSDDERREMRTIKAMIEAGHPEGVPGQILAMERLWKGKGLDGLLDRRDAEAALFSQGLASR
jgi:GH24 family phage-related lysozyme (muramidase)